MFCDVARFSFDFVNGGVGCRTPAWLFNGGWQHGFLVNRVRSSGQSDALPCVIAFLTIPPLKGMDASSGLSAQRAYDVIIDTDSIVARVLRRSLA